MVVFPLLAALFVAFAAFRLTGVDGNRYTACALVLVPYAVAAGAVLGGLGMALGARWSGGVVLASAAALAAGVLPRVVPSRQVRREGRELRVLASNLYLGRADVKAVVELVREHRVDVLHLLELTPEAVEDFTRAGLFELLPERMMRPAPGGAGSGIASRFPMTELALAGPSRHAQPGARIDLGGLVVDALAVHPIPPTLSSATWQAELAGLPAAAPGAPVRLLAGDFNATADHAAFRRLLRAGYVDAAQRRGAGLVPTWPARAFPPPVALDHVLVDARAVVLCYRVLEVPGSDHRAVYAELVVPDPASPV